MNSLDNYLTQIQQDGLKIDTVYDIGANRGHWGQQVKAGSLKNSFFYLFEGNPEHEQSLKNTGLPYYIGILSSPNQTTVDYYKGGDSTGNSYYKENTYHYEGVAPVTMETRTLESVIQEAELPIPNFIKIDTQGSELDVLSGAENILGQVDLVYLECPIAKYNIGAPNIQDYLSYMRGQGFVASSLLEIHEGDHLLVQVDIMFINMRTRERLYGKAGITEL